MAEQKEKLSIASIDAMIAGEIFAALAKAGQMYIDISNPEPVYTIEVVKCSNCLVDRTCVRSSHTGFYCVHCSPTNLPHQVSRVKRKIKSKKKHEN